MAALCVLLTAACAYDYRDKRIPNYLIVMTAALGAAWHFWDTGPPGILVYLGRAVPVMALFYPFFKIGSFGAGDVKLLGVTAGYLPFEKTLIFLFYSLLIAAVISLVKMLKRKAFGACRERLKLYMADVIGSGVLKPYPGRKGAESLGGICLSGPVLVSVLLYLGGVY